MKLVFDLNKSAISGKVQVQRTVTRGGSTFQQHFWVNPSDVKDTDVVVGGQKSQDSLEISEKNFPVGSKLYYKGEEATVERVGKEFSGGGMGIVVRFSKGGTGTIGKSDMKNVSKAPPAKSTTTTDTTAREDYYGAGNFVHLSGSDFSKDMERVKKAPIGCTVKLKYGNKSEEYARKIGDNEWSVDGKKKPLSNNDIASVAYDDGTVNINTMVRQSDSNKKASKDSTDKTSSDKPKLTDPTTHTNPSDIKVGDYIYYEDNEGAGGIKGVTQVKEIKKVVIPKTGKTMYVFNEHGRHDRVSCLEGKTVKKYDTKSKQDAADKTSSDNTNSPNSGSTKSGKFSMDEFTGMKSDRPKALQYLKDCGVSWDENSNAGINWMRACMAASKAGNSAQGATKKDSASKSSTDTKASGKSAEDAKKAVKDLLSANNNDRAKVMQIAKASGVTWKESDNEGINWMRASLAIQKHHESGKTVSASASDDKKGDAKTDDKPSDKKVPISDLKRPASNNTSTNLTAGDYNISVTKLRNAGANAKQNPSFYRIVVEKDGDRVFYTDKTDWSDIKEHAKRYIDAASSSGDKTDKK